MIHDLKLLKNKIKLLIIDNKDNYYQLLNIYKELIIRYYILKYNL